MPGLRGSFGGRRYWARRIAALDPVVDHEEISRIDVEHEFPWDIEQAMSFALFRTYAVPSIGRLLAETGEFTGRTQKRHDDTVPILGALVEHGLDSTEGRAAVRRMNQMHARYAISGDDLRYVLATFVVMPRRWVDDYGYRPLVPAEIEAAVATYRRLGTLMGIRGLPETHEGFARLLDDYEAQHFGYDPASRAVADATLDLFTTFFPRFLAPATRTFVIAIMDPHLREALRYAHPPRMVVTLARAGLRARGRLLRLAPARLRPRPSRSSRRVRSYPGGFLIDHLGT